MKLLTRYVIREHVGPLLFALSALTSLLMLQYVARQLANLAGKGLAWSTIGKWFVLSLPFTIAMTLPMAVLVATLYAFGRMAAEHEITAFKASGVRVRTLMAPVLVCAFFLSVGMVWFNDQVLSRSNHALRLLTSDIARTKPTIGLKEQVMNPITDQFFLRVARTNAATNRMYDVTIYDLRKGPERQTIYADSGLFLLDPKGENLQLQLYDGYAQEFVKGDPRKLQRSFFRVQTVQLKGIVKQFEQSSGDTYKGDREMSVCEMHKKYQADAMEVERMRLQYVDAARRIQILGKQGVRVPNQRPSKEPLARFYCDVFMASLNSLLLPKQAVAQSTQPPATQPPATQSVALDSVRSDSLRRDSLRADSVRRAAPAVQMIQGPVPGQYVPAAVGTDSLGRPKAGLAVLPRGSYVPAPGLTYEQDSAYRARGIDPSTVRQPATVPNTTTPPTDSFTVFRGAFTAAGQQLIIAREGLDSLAVEIHKKFALSFACLVFVLFGPPIALRFPRGGVGVTIGVSIVVFGLYYISLMGGEALADKGKLPAYVAMWIANVVFALAGVALLWSVETTTDTSRGGGVRDWWADRKARRQLARARKNSQVDSPAVPA